MSARIPRAARILLVVYSVVLAIVLFSPTSDEQSGLVVELGHLLARLGVSPTLATFGRLEVVMNAVIVAPVTFLGSIAFPRWTWRDWTAGGFVLAVGVELAQGLLLPDRVASVSDVVANTGGALLGAVVARLVRPMLPSRPSR